MRSVLIAISLLSSVAYGACIDISGSYTCDNNSGFTFNVSVRNGKTYYFFPYTNREYVIADGEFYKSNSGGTVTQCTSDKLTIVTLTNEPELDIMGNSKEEYFFNKEGGLIYTVKSQEIVGDTSRTEKTSTICKRWK